MILNTAGKNFMNQTYTFKYLYMTNKLGQYFRE